MDECKNCANMDNEYCFACDDGNQFKPMTNADRIRSMSDGELAEFLFHAWNNASWCSAKDCPDENSCLPCWIDWLRQKAK